MPKHEWSPFLPCLTVNAPHPPSLSLLPYKTKTAEMFTVISPVWFSCLASLSYLCLIITVLGKGIGMSLALFLCNLFHKLSGAVFGVANCSISSSSLTVIVEVFCSGLKCYQSDVFTTDSLCRNIWGHRIYFDLISCDQSYFSLSVNIFLKTRLSFLFRRVFFAKSSFLIFPQIQNISTQIGMANHLSKIWR